MPSRSLKTLAAAVLYTCVVLVQNAAADTLPRYRITIADRPAQGRFVIVLHSIDTRPLCLAPNWWPNDAGEVACPWVTLESSEKTLEPHGANFGLLGPGSVIRIHPGKSIVGFIAYQQFGSVGSIAKLHRRQLRIQKDFWHPDLCPAGK